MEREASNRLMVWAARASMTVAIMLVVGKALAWWFSQSVAMLGSLTDSSLDLLASLATLFAVKTAIVPPDANHRFGHGKAEALAGLFQSAVMAGSAIFLFLQSLERVVDPQPVQTPVIVVAMSVFAIGLTLVLVMFQQSVVRKTGSLAVAGDHLHYKGDLLLNVGVIAAAVALMLEFPILDPVAGIMIALYILFSAMGVLRPAVAMLMDREFPDEERETIFNLVMESPGVKGLHALKTREAGRDRFMQMHIEVDSDLTVRAAHLIAHEVEATLGEHYPDTEIIIHVDPVSDRSIDLTSQEILPEKE
ncbi:MAG: cation diffusion facilitator family transporter [Kordiimonadaceae bacterium]|nr:cation diffusion facilitator family transporter [Kordiimonadaceae bacterium]MBO6567140.1 cation diffusion facilitator family transporter [Kordiimonadaceae bacterium]MBO6963645.1 cation diffusion facilitator family transporter [Kordiimonadaceae bacterium]